jgi:hypothetical protein
MKTFFWLNGPLELLDDDDRVLATVDVLWFIDHYERCCAENHISFNPRLCLRPRSLSKPGLDPSRRTRQADPRSVALAVPP